MRCKSRKCPSCGQLWAGDVRIKLLRNIEEYGGDVAIVTLTAPGEELLPWDPTWCSHEPHEQCSGRRGCQVEREAARRWNEEAPANWRALHRRAHGRAARVARRLGIKWANLAYNWEFQKRGALHRHIVVPMGTPGERLATLTYIAALDELRQEYAFGFVDRGPKAPPAVGEWIRAFQPDRRGGRPRMPRVIPAGQAAGYLAKYIAGSKKGKPLAITETVWHPDVPGHVVSIGPHLTRRTGCTMRSLRLNRQYSVLAGKADLMGLGHLVDVLEEQDLDLESRVRALIANLPPPRFLAGSRPARTTAAVV